MNHFPVIAPTDFTLVGFFSLMWSWKSVHFILIAVHLHGSSLHHHLVLFLRWTLPWSAPLWLHQWSKFLTILISLVLHPLHHYLKHHLPDGKGYPSYLGILRTYVHFFWHHSIWIHLLMIRSFLVFKMFTIFLPSPLCLVCLHLGFSKANLSKSILLRGSFLFKSSKSF